MTAECNLGIAFKMEAAIEIDHTVESISGGLLTASKAQWSSRKGAVLMLPPLARQVSLVKLLIQTDPSVLPPTLVLGVVSKVCTVVFFALLVVMFAVRRVPLRSPIAFYPRFAAGAGTFLGIGITMLTPEELSSGLYLISLLLIIGGTLFPIWAIR